VALNATIRVEGGGTLTAAGTGSTRKAQFRIGTGPWDALSLALADGTGDLQANQWYVAERTVADGENDSLDLSGALTNDFGVSVALTKVKMLLLAIDAPDGTKRLQVGRAASNGFVGPFVAAGLAVEFDEVFLVTRRWAGWAVTAGTADLLRVFNPSAVYVTYRIFIPGVA
jgi:hypothetical protein